MNKLDEIANFLLKHHQFVISGHIDPDGDCVGSMLALGTALKRLGKEVRIVLERPLPISLSSLEAEWDFLYADKFVFTENDQVFLSLDCGDFARIPQLPKHNLPIVNIDHHLNNSLFGQLNYVNEKAAAVGEIIFLLLKRMNVEIDKKIGYFIAIALIWDTGCFKFSNTNPNVLRITADLLEMGIDTSRIYREFLGSFPLAKLRLKGLIYQNMKLDFAGRVAWVIIDKKMLKEANATLDDAHSISGDLRDIRGVEVGFSILEKEEGVTQLGFRSNYYVPVNEVAMSFGGGGHKRAAGATFNGELSGLAEKILNKISEYLE